MTDPQPTPVDPIGDERAAIFPYSSCFQAEMLLLLRVALADGPMDDRTTGAIQRVASGIGIPDEAMQELLAELGAAQGGQASFALAGLEKSRRLSLFSALEDIVRNDPELGEKSRFARRLRAILDLTPDDRPDASAP